MVVRTASGGLINSERRKHPHARGWTRAWSSGQGPRVVELGHAGTVLQGLSTNRFAGPLSNDLCKRRKCGFEILLWVVEPAES